MPCLISLLLISTRLLFPFSARENLGLDELREIIARVLAKKQTALKVLIPYDRGKAYSHLYDKGYIQSRKDK